LELEQVDSISINLLKGQSSQALHNDKYKHNPIEEISHFRR